MVVSRLARFLCVMAKSARCRCVGEQVVSARSPCSLRRWRQRPPADRGQLWLAAALAVSGAVALMRLTRTLRPLGGATALVAVFGDGICRRSYLYAIARMPLDARSRC